MGGESINKSAQEEGEYKLFHNPGYDFRRLIWWTKEIDPHSGKNTIAPYFIPILALLGACFAIEGYVNAVGRHVDSNWTNFEKGPIALKKRLQRIYSKINKKLDCGQDIWQEVLSLFKARIEIVHPKLVHKTERRANEISTLFERVAQDYPRSESERICERAIDILLADANLQHLKGQWLWGGYVGPPRR